MMNWRTIRTPDTGTRPTHPSIIKGRGLSFISGLQCHGAREANQHKNATKTLLVKQHGQLLLLLRKLFLQSWRRVEETSNESSAALVETTPPLVESVDTSATTGSDGRKTRSDAGGGIENSADGRWNSLQERSCASGSPKC